jgi:hypothetical protein
MPGEAHAADHLRGFSPQIFKNASLHNPKQSLVVPFLGIQAALCPEVRAFHRFFGVGVVKRVRAFVKCHDDISAKVFLDRDGALGGQAFHGSVDVRFKSDAIRVNLARIRQREDLETARIGQHRFMPLHELMQTTHLRH